MYRNVRIIIVLLCVLLVAGGCGADQAELTEVYEEGYADGYEAAQKEAEEEDGPVPADCRDCYALGWDEGYQKGYADGAAAG